MASMTTLPPLALGAWAAQPAVRCRDRRGWRHNRRAVVADPAGLTVVPWLGRSRRTPWTDVLRATWLANRRLLLTTVSGDLVLTAPRADLRALLAAIETYQQHLPTDECDERDVLRWLGGRQAISIDPTVRVHGFDTLGCLGAWDIQIGCGCPIWLATVPAAVIAFACGWPHWSAWLLTFLLAPLFAPVGEWILDRLKREPAGHHHLVANEEGCHLTVQKAAGDPPAPAYEVDFGWREVRALDRQRDGWVVHLDGAEPIFLPEDRRFEPVVRALRAVAHRQAGFTVEAAGRGLSSAEPPGPRVEVGLSRSKADSE
ncbi:MAG: hypothetical protein HZB16_04700 [Armatimonadetes bacterium]|nr:hypothetical protein [Armatimonadota bacterium]